MPSLEPKEDRVYGDRIEDRVRQCYEAAMETRLGEKAAIDAALVLWRAARPDEGLVPARQAVAEIIARSRIEKRAAGPVED
jgi:hypothetical protein